MAILHGIFTGKRTIKAIFYYGRFGRADEAALFLKPVKPACTDFLKARTARKSKATVMKKLNAFRKQICHKKLNRK